MHSHTYIQNEINIVVTTPFKLQIKAIWLTWIKARGLYKPLKHTALVVREW